MNDSAENISNVDMFFSKLSARLGFPMHVSPISLPIVFDDDRQEPFQCNAHIALFGRRAVRVDVVDDDIIHIGIWTSPGNLQRPQYIIYTDEMAVKEQVYLAAETILGRAQNFIYEPRQQESLTSHERLLLESSKDDVENFLQTLGSAARHKKISELYRQYITWATMNQAKPLSDMRFRSLVKQWLYTQEALPPVQAGGTDSEVVTTQAEESEFVQDIMKNEILYKAALLESTVTRIAQNDPGVTALFLCGSAGLGKTHTVRKVLQENSAMDRVIWKTGTISGFTGLLQLLWDYRRGKIIVLDDNDDILSNKRGVNILKGALNSDPAERVVSYVRKR